ncbi:MAG: phage integrase N-terminal SAM-like domain-containing protein, partial [Gemmatimonadota bacterium]
MPPRGTLLDQVHREIRARHLSLRTEEAYVSWIRRFVRFHGERHPGQMGASEIRAFLTYLAARRRVAASTQNQAASALLFLYREVLGIEVEYPSRIVRAKTPKRLPVVLTSQEILRGAENRLHGGVANVFL